jgi:hypothetical protein
VTVKARRVERWPYADGGLAEHCDGTLTLLGVAYSFRCCAYSVPDAYVGRCLTEVSASEPISCLPARGRAFAPPPDGCGLIAGSPEKICRSLRARLFPNFSPRGSTTDQRPQGKASMSPKVIRSAAGL